MSVKIDFENSSCSRPKLLNIHQQLYEIWSRLHVVVYMFYTKVYVNLFAQFLEAKVFNPICHDYCHGWLPPKESWVLRRNANTANSNTWHFCHCSGIKNQCSIFLRIFLRRIKGAPFRLPTSFLCGILANYEKCFKLSEYEDRHCSCAVRCHRSHAAHGKN